MIRQFLDVMHIEMNLFDNIFNTVMLVEKGTKDHICACRDLQDLGIRNALHTMGKKIPMALYTLDNRRIYILLEWLKTLRFIDGYLFDLARNIDMTKHSIFRRIIRDEKPRSSRFHETLNSNCFS